MIENPYQRLEDVVADPVFPDVDLALRRGRHIDQDDAEWYAFLTEAQPFLEALYRRFGCELIRVVDGYYYLLPSGDRLGRRQLTRGEMLVGQGLALMLLDPATVRAAGVVPAAQLIEVLGNLVGRPRLIVALSARRTAPRDERVAEQLVRKEIARAIRGLERLGFIEQRPDEQIRLRTPLLRFSDPVRGLSNRAAALARLIERGEVVLEQDDEADDDAPDEEPLDDAEAADGEEDA